MKRSSHVQRSYERSELEKAGQVSHRAPVQKPAQAWLGRFLLVLAKRNIKEELLSAKTQD